jgi:hypothetical protein
MRRARSGSAWCSTWAGCRAGVRAANPKVDSLEAGIAAWRIVVPVK